MSKGSGCIQDHWLMSEDWNQTKSKYQVSYAQYHHCFHISLIHYVKVSFEVTPIKKSGLILSFKHWANGTIANV